MSGTQIYIVQGLALTNTSLATNENPVQGILVQDVLQGGFQGLEVVVRKLRQDGMFLSRLDRDVIRRLVARLAAENRGTATDDDFLAVQDEFQVLILRTEFRLREQPVHPGRFCVHQGV